ncbi:hypothetical protein [Methanocella arvoryzae]|uniref:Uncharacterized protein n=1 Tax=Methanocella arvoryzae (strain DSM 22066 / NBRC 105507 / MRE50) TaxID=351160 RepID=Q0W4P5_METAR|nr:hypothetical protein [Methanocella arvoryzae]CAJ36648.1 hypothetical protein RCIX1366 [Methanocella arvoryzae MRE50]
MANIKVVLVEIASQLVALIICYLWLISILIATISVYGDADKTPVIINTINLWAVMLWVAFGMIAVISILCHTAFMMLYLRGTERAAMLKRDISYLIPVVSGIIIWFIGLIFLGILNVPVDSKTVILPGYVVILLCLAPKIFDMFRKRPATRSDT